ncbi:bifunctional phosphopantothenoylcysteine decarboxylase/phosphopantothenate--cysteine ligase CoaBC [Corynebacterium guangdongense]|uniref:Coenzyme A biosynthesis bifunctional protein CoaBC n=1 Tax=Corynebacterium guangdongense TaxID=1783348 RepID=A0ABU1ZYD5_9CORY|nr:bifunctional phosphopantothenoylcysteine decarboxylase/phosphopantothenate--cysteine ligase CoaBC [Corynebacterium guangdongense]MDR7329413.1 phosphopantothenoylcysteine decarboxylase/phosphopantothenate--cysteine ligase [Corynebacterium guangdongense]WJZ17978.1 Coenzyme A biosynthesis bifunctional protein CoaBC [Corynebacterium guangdongense]
MQDESGQKQGHRIVLGVGGGIAAYKACHVVRDLKEAGDDVRVIPTESALKFVGAATFEALSGHPVSTTVFDAVDEVQHVRLGQEADLIVIAPATADLLARLAGGRADDLLTASVLVATCPVLIVPAMHTEMWFNPATRRNVEILRGYGYTVMEPAHGRLTGKDTGPGRLPEPEQIADLARTLAAGFTVPHSWAGLNVLISAGGTQEPIDPVRFIGNRSSGRQGFALAEIAAQRGASVTLVAGDTAQLPTPPGAKVIRVRSTGEMKEAMDDRAAGADVIIMAAAVADFRPQTAAATKMKKGSESAAGLTSIEMIENPDILAGLVQSRRDGELQRATTIVGFAAETGDERTSALEYAKAKLARKGCDLLMANDVSGDAVFGKLRNRGWLLSADGTVAEVRDGTKLDVAAQILAAVDAHRTRSLPN